MALPDIASREEWHAARVTLLAEEKAMTRARDALSTRRRLLPMVRLEKDYQFERPGGTATLRELFDGRRQLVVQHFMFDPSWDEGCPSCTATLDEMSPGLVDHLQARSTTFAVVSRTPLDKIERYRSQRGWPYPWYSSYGSDFNYDFHVTIDSSVAPVEYNYRDAGELAAAGMEWMLDGSHEQPGYSVFLADGDDVFHTYSTFARGTEWILGAYAFLDLTSLGRQEDWEEPKGRADDARAPIPVFTD